MKFEFDPGTGKAKVFPVHKTDSKAMSLVRSLGKPGRFTRLSYIIPDKLILVPIFYLARAVGLANWTRRWNCTWSVIYKRRIYRGFKTRQEAIEFEINLIENGNT